jgi:cold shock protein
VADVVVLCSCQLRAEGKCYRFIARADGPDVFVHYLGIDGYAFRSLEEGHHVVFEEIQGPRSPQTTSVRAARAGHAIGSRRPTRLVLARQSLPRWVPGRLRSAARPRTQATLELRCFSSRMVGH